MEKNVLVVDWFWPSKLAKWRIINIEAFIDHFTADILALKTNIFWALPKNDDDFSLTVFKKRDDYDFLIFDPSFNWINKYNSRIDGTVWNGYYPNIGFYLMRHKSKPPLDPTSSSSFFTNYDAYYHIFIDVFCHFCSVVPGTPSQKHWIHLYPGGGMIDSNSILKIDNNTTIITTQRYISNLCNTIPVRQIKLGFVPLLGENESITKFISEEKIYRKNKIFTVCFTCLGDPISKGYYLFEQMAVVLTKIFGSSLIKFVTVGTINTDYISNNLIEHKGIMSQNELCQFYTEEVDIYVNADNGSQYNGWPLGAEAVLAGCLLITTDPRGENQHYFNFTEDEIVIFEPANLEITISVFFYRLFNDSNLIKSMAIAAERKFRQLGSFDCVMKPILEDIKRNINT